jgi:glycosyltransferase involved in cell wall biosynthesis
MVIWRKKMGDGSSSEQRTLWLLITALTVGGAEQTLVELANNVDRDTYDVTIWTIFDTNPLESDLRKDVTVKSLTDAGKVENGYVVAASNPLAYISAPLRFWYAAAVNRPDIIHSFILFDNFLAGVAGLVCPATVITGVRNVPNDRSTARTLLERATLRLPDLIVSNSKAGVEFAVELGADPDRVTIVPNGRDVEQFHTASPDAVYSELDIGDDQLVVGTVGRLKERKGHFELLTAWADVQRRTPNARLLLVGEGEEHDALRAHAAELGCRDSVEFLGHRRDIPELLAAMDIFAFPSHYEGLPGAVIEAMAAGCPIVATPVDGTKDLLDGYRNGLFVPVEAPDELGWAISRLIQTPELRATLGEAAQAEASAEYTIETMVARFESLYEASHDSQGSAVPKVRKQ